MLCRRHDRNSPYSSSTEVAIWKLLLHETSKNRLWISIFFKWAKKNKNLKLCKFQLIRNSAQSTILNVPCSKNKHFHFSPWLGLPDRFFEGQRQWFPYSQEAIERAHCPCWVAARTQPWWTDRWTYWTETLTCCAAPSDLELPSPIRHNTHYGHW